MGEMRRFLRIARDDEYDQMQLLVAKCSQLMQEKALLERELLLLGERERALVKEVKALSMRVCQQEQANVQLRLKHEQVLDQVHQQQVSLQEQQRLSGGSNAALEAGPWDAELLSLHLKQVCSELEQLQASEARLESLLDEMQSEGLCRTAQLQQQVERMQEESVQRAAQVQELQTQLDSRTQELEELQCYHQGAVEELRAQNQSSLGKLQETAEQFEWLCEEQRNWMCCVKRFKDCMSEEKEVLLHQLSKMEVELTELRRASEGGASPKVDAHYHIVHSRPPMWDVDLMADLQAEVDRWRHLYEDLCSKLSPPQEAWVADRSQKPP